MTNSFKQVANRLQISSKIQEQLRRSGPLAHSTAAPHGAGGLCELLAPDEAPSTVPDLDIFPKAGFNWVSWLSSFKMQSIKEHELAVRFLMY